MSVKTVVPGVYQVALGVVNAFFLEDGDGLALIDTGVAGSEEKILEAAREVGGASGRIRQILVTHLHADHTGSLAALKRATDAPAAMHPTDAALTRVGQAARAMVPGPGLLNKVLVRIFMRNAPTTVEPADIEQEIEDGDELPVAGGLRVVHAPGHAAGQVAFLWPQQGGVLFAGDAASHVAGRLGPSLVYEDLAEGQRSLAKLAALQFEVACFGHGDAIKTGAAEKFRAKWSMER